MKRCTSERSIRSRFLILVAHLLLASTAAPAQIAEIIDITGDGAGRTLADPVAIAIDTEGNAYVVGTFSHNAFRITPDGSISAIIDTSGDGTGNTLTYPSDVAVDADGNVYVAGSGSDNVFRVSPGGIISEIIGAEGDGDGKALEAPSAIAVDASGAIYVAGKSSDNAFRITPEGAITEIIDATGDGSLAALTAPSDVAVDSSGNVYVVGSWSDNVFKIASNGVVSEIINAAGDGHGNTLRTPVALAADAIGHVYVLGWSSHNAFRIAPGGSAIEIIDASGDGFSNALGWPDDIAADASGNVYVTGATNALQVTPYGLTTEILGAAGDGMGGTLESPGAIAVAASGDVYVTGRRSDNAFHIVPPAIVCGDGKVTAAEPCDDGGRIQGDGCDASCRVEPGWTCDGEPSVCTGPRTPYLDAGDLLVIHEAWPVLPSAVLRVDPSTGAQSIVAILDNPGHSPTAIVVDDAGDLLVGEAFGFFPRGGGSTGYSGITRVDPLTGYQSVLVTFPNELGTLPWIPRAIAIDALGDLIVAMPMFAGILRVDPVTGTDSLIVDGSFALQGLTDVAIDANGDLIALTTRAIIRVDPVTGAESVIAEGEFGGGITIDASGDLLVTAPTPLPARLCVGGSNHANGCTDPVDCPDGRCRLNREQAEDRILRVDPETGDQLHVSTGGYGLVDIVVDAKGDIFVAEWIGSIRRVDAQSGIQTVVSEGLRFVSDLAIVVDPIVDDCPVVSESASGDGNADSSDDTCDEDGDGVLNVEEAAIGTDVDNPDTDGDGMDDGFEVTFGLEPLVDDSADDADGDGINNLAEYLEGTDPTRVPEPSLFLLQLTALVAMSVATRARKTAGRTNRSD